MASSEDDDEPMPGMTVVHARSGADFEAGRGQPRGEHIDGVDVVDPRLPDNGRAGSSGAGSSGARSSGAGSSSGGGQQRLAFGQGKQADKKRQLWNRRRPGRSRSGDTSLVTDIKVG